MSWGFVAIAGATLVSGQVASNSASRGQKAAAKGEAAALEESQRQFDLTREDFAPFQGAGVAALEQQRILLGLGGTDPSSQQRTDLQSQLEAINQEEKSFSDRFGGKTTGRAGLVNRAGMELSSKQNFDQQRADIQSQLDVLPEFSPGTAQEQQQAAFDRLADSPGQQFLRDRAQKNLLRNTSAIGGLGGGNVRSALVQQGVGFAQQDLQNQFGRLGQLAGQGQAATASAAQFGGNISQNIANQAIASGQNRASGIAQQSQITQNTIGGLSNLFGQFSQRQNNSGLI